ncbi:helix-turn-helix domain-containing protein [Phytomonospora sp. NPDC050363]|uniref:TetR/AcrR family transcriptional regulator n=1 Tax=Phytomonospora sp. NPDC050363 TaxID=3155642 RepID=UPI0033FECDEF
MSEEAGQGMRERKKQRTRRVIIETAYRLFGEHGYEETTVNQIAAAADVSPGTFFNHFPAKEDVVFSEPDLLDLAVRRIAEREPGEAPVDVLVRTIAGLLTGPRDPGDELEVLRLRLTMTVPALRSAVLQRLFDAQERFADALRATRPGELGEIEALALIGAVIGAMMAAARGALVRDLPLPEAVDTALAGIAASLRQQPRPERTDSPVTSPA